MHYYLYGKAPEYKLSLFAGELQKIFIKVAESIEPDFFNLNKFHMLCEAFNHAEDITSAAIRYHNSCPCPQGKEDLYPVGEGELDDTWIANKIKAILLQAYDELAAAKKEKMRKFIESESELKQLFSQITSIDTKMYKIADEGGYTREYIHSVLMPSGKKYTFLDRNVFDFGREINYKGMLFSRKNGVYGWDKKQSNGSWEFVPVADDDEAIIACRVASYFGFYDCCTRM